MNIRTTHFALLGCALAALAMPAYADSPTTPAAAAPAASGSALRVALVDTQMIINSTNASKRAVQELTSKKDAAQAKINAMEKPLIEKQEKLREQQAVMSADKFQQAQADFGKELTKFRTDAQAIQVDLDTANLKLRKQITDAVREAIAAVARDKGFDVVLPKSVSLYNSAKLVDISAEVLTRANQIMDK